MELRAARRFRSRSRGDLASWAVLGFGAGLAAGFLVAELLGAGAGLRARRLVSRLRGTAQAPRAGAAALQPLRQALADDADLAGHPFEVLPVGRTGVEIHGWVPSRRHRTRAFRLARDAAGPLAVVNCILVRGEDDLAPAPALADDAPRSA